MKVILYARVSDPSQDPLSQLPRLRAWAQTWGHEVVTELVEVASTRLTRRPLRDKAMAMVRGRHAAGVAVCKLDRWGRSVLDISTSLQEVKDRGARFWAIDQNIEVGNKENALSDFLLHILAAVAELERSLISERTKAGMAYIRASKHIGRHRKGCSRKPCTCREGVSQNGPPVLMVDPPLASVPFPPSRNSSPSEKSTPREVESP